METATQGITEIIAQREKQLFAIGLAKHKFGFAFKMFHVTAYDIENMNKPDWDKYIVYVGNTVSAIKREVETPLTDPELLLGFGRQLRAITGPEVKLHSAQEVVTHVLTVLTDLSEYVDADAKRMQ